MPQMTPKERFIAALERRPIKGRVPHFELVFYLTMEAFGEVHPTHRRFGQWFQMREEERELHLQDIADVYIMIAEHYEHDAIFIQGAPDAEALLRLFEIVQEKTQDRYFLMIHGDATYSVPDGDHMMDFAYRLVDDAEGLKKEAQARVDRALERAAIIAEQGILDGFALCADYCFNDNPFLSPDQFAVFVAPYLKELIAGYRDMGFHVIKHTDGNIMPIIDQLVDANPHALHSLDPQGGIDIAEVKRRYGDQICLIGNVNCGLLDTGTDEEVIESARYALRHGMPGGGYIFSTSNCIYTGMRLERYDLMLDVWRKEGNYD